MTKFSLVIDYNITTLLTIAGILGTLFACNFLHAVWNISKSIQQKDFSKKPKQNQYTYKWDWKSDYYI